MSKNIKLPVPQSRSEMESLVGEIADLQLKLNHETNLMDGIITSAREDFEPKITSLQKQIQEKTLSAHAWCSAHPEEFGNRKSIEMIHGIVGFRTGTPKLKNLRGFTWEQILKTLKLLKLEKYIRTKEEVDKESVIADRIALADDGLRSLGMKIVQDETFHVEPKLTATK